MEGHSDAAWENHFGGWHLVHGLRTDVQDLDAGDGASGNDMMHHWLVGLVWRAKGMKTGVGKVGLGIFVDFT